MRPRVLVTGATGFVARHALPALVAAGADVHALARSPGTDGQAITWHAGDLLDTAATRDVVRRIGPTHVLHAAWYVEPGAFWSAPQNLDWVGATLALAQAAAAEGVGRFVGVGTCVEYDWSDGGSGHRREDDALTPSTLYGTAKAATASVLHAFGAQAGLEIAWGRLFHLYGPGENPRRLVGSLFAALKEGRPADLASGRPVRDFLCTVEAGRALAALTLSPATGPVNVASGQGIAVADLAREIAAMAGRPDLLRLGARPDPAGEATRMVADVSRLRDEVGFAVSADHAQWLQRLWSEVRSIA